MRKLALLSVAFPLVAVSFYGCDETNLTEPSVTKDESAAFNWLNNPYNGNPRILRGVNSWIMCWSDAENTGRVSNGLRGCMGTRPLREGSESDCGLQEEGDPIEWQHVGVWDRGAEENSWIHETQKGQVWITVRDTNTPGDCLGSALVAEGYGRFMLNDNDIIGGNGGNANVWKFKSQGSRLLTPEGSYVSYNAHMQLRYNNKKGLFYVTSSKVEVH